jgi:hypothetical protein
MFYSLVIHPLLLVLNKAAGIPAGNPTEAAVIRDWPYGGVVLASLKTFNIAAGPIWCVASAVTVGSMAKPQPA